MFFPVTRWRCMGSANVVKYHQAGCALAGFMLKYLCNPLKIACFGKSAKNINDYLRGRIG